MKNNFDFLRLLFALFVVITHSYVLSGTEEKDWMEWITNGQASFSYIGVRGFFIISGFLIFKSLERSPSITQYYKNRILRVYPALFVVLVLTIALGIFVYEHDSISFLGNYRVWTYLPNNISLFRLQYAIPGIFENNPYASAINGSLWTIPYEFTFYMLTSLLFFSNDKCKKIVLILTVVLLFTGRYFFYDKSSPFGTSIISGRFFLDLGLYFFIGSLLASISFEKSTNLTAIFFASLLLLTFLIVVGTFDKAQYLLLPLIIISFGLLSTKSITTLRDTFGDLSYGIYIFSFPIQQTLVYFFEISYSQLMIYSIMISITAGYLSWHFVEKRVLEFKTFSWSFARR